MGDNGKRLRQEQERLGEINISNEGYEMKIIEYNNARDILVEFQDEHKAKVTVEYSQFKKGEIKNPFHKSIFGVGYLGKGEYEIRINGKQTIVYIRWFSMMQRCYDPYFLNKEPTYIDCYVCEEWHNFQNFCKWFYKHEYRCEKDDLCLDKDILIKDNKIYSPQTCILVPKRINNLFTKRNKSRGKYPIGVSWHKASNKFQAKCSILDRNGKNKTEFLGYYNTSKEAFYAYKNFKENYIKQIADEYKDAIPQKLYDAMYRWEVGIDD